MAMSLLGKTIDIHSGGVDLVFPHHENERAQSESVTGQPFVRYWVHNGFLNVRDERTGEEEKMSKSLGNFFRIDEVLALFDPLTVRHFLLSAQYRSPLTFSQDNLKASQAAAGRILEALARTERILGADKTVKADATLESAVDQRIQDLREQFRKAMNDDLNTPVALSVLFAIVQELNRALDQAGLADPKAASRGRSAAEAFRRELMELLDVLGLDPALAKRAKGQEDALVPALMELLISIRAEARKRKLYDLADKIRADLAARKIALEDTPQGTIWKRIS